MHDGLLLPTNLMQFIPTGFEWIFLIVIVVVLIFGAKKIPELARGFGRATSEFEKAKVEANRELHNIKKNETTGNTTASRDKLESIADTLGIDYTNKDDESLRLAIEKELNKDKNIV
jgi:sec-independent protein translocase protein TatA